MTRLKLNQAALANIEMQKAFGEFGEWLLIEIGGQKAALTIHRYLQFFLEIDKCWGSIPTYGDLLGHFSAEGLRRVRLPMRWLEKNGNMIPDADAREADSERRRINAILTSIPSGTPAAKELAAYHDKLMKRVSAGKSTLRSTRLALRPAVSLLLAAAPDGIKMPDSETLSRYLLEAPGQKAAITGFVNYLNGRYNLNLVAKASDKQARAARRKRLEGELMALVREGGDGDDFRRRWLSVALAYFHGLPKKLGLLVKDKDISVDNEGGMHVSVDGREYWIPIFSSRKRLLLSGITQPFCAE